MTPKQPCPMATTSRRNRPASRSQGRATRGAPWSRLVCACAADPRPASPGPSALGGCAIRRALTVRKDRRFERRASPWARCRRGADAGSVTAPACAWRCSIGARFERVNGGIACGAATTSASASKMPMSRPMARIATASRAGWVSSSLRTMVTRGFANVALLALMPIQVQRPLLAAASEAVLCVATSAAPPPPSRYPRGGRPTPSAQRHRSEPRGVPPLTAPRWLRTTRQSRAPARGQRPASKRSSSSNRGESPCSGRGPPAAASSARDSSTRGCCPPTQLAHSRKASRAAAA